jgi:RNA-splicing ligase RtcB
MTKIDIDNIIREKIPFGTNVQTRKNVFDINDKIFWLEMNFDLIKFTKEFNSKYDTNFSHEEMNYRELTEMCNEIGMDGQRAILSLGTLGGGNHFIEIGKSEETKNYHVTIHSGSRQFGLKICHYWQRKAGKGALAFLTGEDMFGYLADMIIAQKYAQKNRELMAEIITDILDTDMVDPIESVHNYINFEDWIIRKGAISSYEDEKMIIPLNMEDGSLICVGKSNPEWNFSAPHGAGRVGSRRWAKDNLIKEDAQERMIKKGIYCSKLPIDETRDAYKNGQDIIDSLDQTATLLEHIKPVLAIKE